MVAASSVSIVRWAGAAYGRREGAAMVWGDWGGMLGGFTPFAFICLIWYSKKSPEYSYEN
jgi:hypothetical protein